MQLEQHDIGDHLPEVEPQLNLWVVSLLIASFHCVFCSI